MSIEINKNDVLIEQLYNNLSKDNTKLYIKTKDKILIDSIKYKKNDSSYNITC